MFSLTVSFLLALNLVNNVSCQQRVAVAHLTNGTVIGSIYFTESEEGIHVTGSITGLASGLYGFHIHELGDTSDCYATGSHFNPDGNNHGGRDHDERHVGDLGNVEFIGADAAVAVFNFTDTVIALRGRNNIIGRTLVLHEDTDDLGLGGDANSLLTGNAGARVACGVIGIRSPSEPWNAAASLTSSVLILISALFCGIFN